MNAGEARGWAARKLSSAGIVSPCFEADLLVCEVAELSSAKLLAYPERTLDEDGFSRLSAMVTRRVAHEPLQYILGRWDFYGRSLSVAANVLIPRPETELLVEKALERLISAPGTFLDWGTGSGCVALSILSERADLKGIAADVNSSALLLAWKNLKKYELLSRCLLWHTRSPVDIPAQQGSLSMIVSNPPYIPSYMIKSLMTEVRQEPRSALDGGEDGLRWYRALFEWGPEKIRRGGWMLFEIGSDAQVEQLIESAPSNLELDGIFHDLQHKPRVVSWLRV